MKLAPRTPQLIVLNTTGRHRFMQRGRRLNLEVRPERPFDEGSGFHDYSFIIAASGKSCVDDHSMALDVHPCYECVTLFCHESRMKLHGWGSSHILLSTFIG
jgi:hypothetical protein